MNDHIVLPRDLSTSTIVEPGMSPARPDTDLVPHRGVEAAKREFEAAYWTGEEELLAALRAANPFIRADEDQLLAETIRLEISAVPLGPNQESIREGLRQALRVIEARNGVLAQP